MTPSAALESESVVQLRRLLVAYQAAAWAAVDAPHVFLLQRGSRRFGRLVWLPRPRLLLRYFVVQHIHARLDELERHFSALAAFSDGKEHAQAREVLADFRRSLPTRVSRKLLALGSVVLVLFGTRLLSQLTFDLSNPDDRQELELLINLQDSLLSLNVEGGFLNALVTTPIPIVLDLVSGLILCAYFVLRAGYPGFRLKRMLFNVSPGGVDALKHAVVRDYPARSDGVYALEREVFAALEARTRREFPFDLVVSAIWAAFWTAIAAVGLQKGELSDPMIVIVPALLRLAWLARIWRRRIAVEKAHAVAVPQHVLAPALQGSG